LPVVVRFCRYFTVVKTDQHVGSDGVRLWDVKTQSQLPIPNQHHLKRGQASYVLWLTRKFETDEMLCYGTGLGYVVFWGQKTKRVRAP